MADEETAVEAEEVDDTEHEDAGAVAAAEAQAKTELESRARRMGWRPKEEFRGDPNRWTDAKAFIERGEAELPVLRERYRALDDRFAQLEQKTSARETDLNSQLSEVKQTLHEFRQFAQRADERSYARAKAEIETKMASAVETADRPGYANARAELDALERGRAEAPKAVTAAAVAPAKKEEAANTEPHPEVKAWVAENPWFNADKAMAQYAIAVHGQIMAERPGMSMRDNLAEVKADVMARFPEKFGNKRREEAAAVATATTTAPLRRKGKHPEFKDWPMEAKAAFNKFKKQMPTYTTEEYAKLYFAGAE